MATSEAHRRSRGWVAGHPVALAPGVVVVIGLVVFLALRPVAVPPAPAGTLQPLGWTGALTGNFSVTNGLVEVAVEPTPSAASFSGTDEASGTGIRVALVGVQEIGANGALIATGNLSVLPNSTVPAKSVQNSSTSEALGVSYRQPVAVVRPSGVVLPERANVTVSLATGANSSAGRNLTYGIEVGGWPWVHLTDALVLRVAVLPVVPANLTLENGSTNTLDGVPTADASHPAESVVWASTVFAKDEVGDEFQLPLASTALPNGTGLQLELGVQGGSDGYGLVRTAVVIAGYVPSPVSPPSAALVLLCVGWAGVVGTVVWVAVWREGEQPLGWRSPPVPKD